MKKIPPELEAKIVRLHFAEGMRFGEIARNVDVHHSVVRRVLGHVQVPALPVVHRACKIDDFRPWLAETVAEHPHICGSRLFAMAQQRGYQGGISRLREFVRTIRPKPKPEAFLRLHKLPGEEVQIDWGHFGNVQVGRATRPLVMFCMTLSYSRACFLRFFHDAKMANFQTGHVEGYRFLGGVARKSLYDNLKSAVLCRVGQTMEFNPNLLELASHYKFEPRAAGPARGNEKGRVERTIRYVRDSFYAARDWVSLDQINEEAKDWCRNVAAKRRWVEDREREVQDVWDEERLKLLPLPDDDFPAHECVVASVGRTPYIRFDKNDYSVPYTHVRQNVTILADSRRIRIADGETILAEHVRSFSKGETIENPEHVDDLVTWKRNARQSSATSRLVHAAPASQKWLELVVKRGIHLQGQTKRLEELLAIYGAAALNAALLTLTARETIHLPSLERLLDADRRSKELPLNVCAVEMPSPRLENVIVRAHDLRSYSKLEATDEGETSES